MPATQALILSAQFSHLGKWILPPFWLTLWGYFTFLMFTDPERVKWASRLRPPDVAKWVFLGIGLLALWLMARYLVPLKRVELRGGSLVVSNWRRELLVPLTEIRGVRWLFSRGRDNAGLVVIELRSGRSDGRRILFVPRSAAVGDELRALVTRAAGPCLED